MIDRARLRARGTIVALIVLFAGPVLLALWLNVAHEPPLRIGMTNRGELLNPALFVSGDALVPVAGWDRGRRLRDAWTIVISADDCAMDCDAALFASRQARLATGKNADRVARLLVLGTDGDPPGGEILAVHADIGIAHAPTRWMEALRARGTGAAIFLVDPQGYVILRYPGSAGPKALVKDLERLLKISKIG